MKTNLNKSFMLEKALDNIDPSRSHTYHKGMSGGWRKTLTEEHKKEIKAIAGDLLIDLGYENDFDW